LTFNMLRRINLLWFKGIMVTLRAMFYFAIQRFAK
jgi:hypothetical protein